MDTHHASTIKISMSPTGTPIKPIHRTMSTERQETKLHKPASLVVSDSPYMGMRLWLSSYILTKL